MVDIRRSIQCLLLLLCAGLAFGPGHSTLAAQTLGPGGQVAGLVVDYGDGRRSYALVPFSEPSISGIELLRRSGLSLVAVSFGGLGEAVCEIELTGCELDACRRRLCQTSDRSSPFWQYARMTSDGTWTSLALGASSSQVGGGEIDGWAWTGSAPDLPLLTLDDIGRRLGVEGRTDALAEPLAITDGETTPRRTGTWPDYGIAAGIVLVMAAAGGWSVWTMRRRSHQSAVGDRA